MEHLFTNHHPISLSEQDLGKSWSRYVYVKNFLRLLVTFTVIAPCRYIWRAVSEKIITFLRIIFFFWCSIISFLSTSDTFLCYINLVFVDMKYFFVQHQHVFVEAKLLFVQRKTSYFNTKLFFVQHQIFVLDIV